MHGPCGRSAHLVHSTQTSWRRLISKYSFPGQRLAQKLWSQDHELDYFNEALRWPLSVLLLTFPFFADSDFDCTSRACLAKLSES